MRLALSKGPNRVGVCTPHLRTETDPVSEKVCTLLFLKNTVRRKKSKDLPSYSICLRSIIILSFHVNLSRGPSLQVKLSL
jgi:hypothetical protein